MANAGQTILIGLVVVFSVLILLTLIFYLFGRIMDRKGGKAPAQAKPAVKSEPVPPAAPVKMAAASPVTAADDDEVIAVIAAAVAAMGASEGKRYAVRKVTRCAWRTAGLGDGWLGRKYPSVLTHSSGILSWERKEMHGSFMGSDCQALE